MKTDTHLRYFAQFFVESETFQTKVLEKSKYTFYVQNILFKNRVA